MSAPSVSGLVVTGGGAGGIDGQDGARRMGRIGGGLDVDHIPGRVERRFDPHEVGLAVAEAFGERCRIARIEQRQADAAAGLRRRFSQSRVP